MTAVESGWQGQRLGGPGPDRPGHHHQVGRRRLLRLPGGLRRGARRGADGLPALLRQPDSADLGDPRRGFHPPSHRLQLPAGVHQGPVSLPLFFRAAQPCGRRCEPASLSLHRQVQVTLAESKQHTFRSCDGCRYTLCLCGEESATFSWIVTPAVLGSRNELFFSPVQQTSDPL